MHKPLSSNDLRILIWREQVVKADLLDIFNFVALLDCAVLGFLVFQVDCFVDVCEEIVTLSVERGNLGLTLSFAIIFRYGHAAVVTSHSTSGETAIRIKFFFEWSRLTTSSERRSANHPRTLTTGK